MTEKNMNLEEAVEGAREAMTFLAKGLEYTGARADEVIEDIETVTFGCWDAAAMFFLPTAMKIMDADGKLERARIWIPFTKKLGEVADKIKDMQTTIDSLQMLIKEETR